MNLSETKVIAKRVVLIAVLMTILYYVGVVIIKGGKAFFDIFTPDKPVLPEAKFGKLDKLQMQNIKLNDGIEYYLDTTTGGLPQFPDRFYIYKFVEPTPSLRFEQQMKTLAEDLGYQQAPTKTSNSDFKWVDGTNKRQMTGNIVTKYFDSTTEMSKLSSVLSTLPSIKDTDAIDSVKNFLSSEGLVEKTDLDSMQYTTVPTIINFGKFRDTRLFPSSAKLMKVDSFRHLITLKQEGRNLVPDKDYKILGPNPKNSLITFYISNTKEVFKQAQINFKYQKINYEEKSDYYLSPITAVWETVKQGNGIVAYAKLKSSDYYSEYAPNNINKINIRDVYIAYYEPDQIVKYLQPIYVFEGVFTTQSEDGKLPLEGEIVIYFPAVSGDFVN